MASAEACHRPNQKWYRQQRIWVRKLQSRVCSERHSGKRNSERTPLRPTAKLPRCISHTDPAALLMHCIEVRTQGPTRHIRETRIVARVAILENSRANSGLLLPSVVCVALAQFH